MSTTLPGSLDEALRLERAGQRHKMLTFWGHRPARPGLVDQACLSQWWPAAFEVDGQRFRTAEHFMMAHKAWLFDDPSTASRILEARSPAQAKDLGRRVARFDDAVWVEHRHGIVRQASLAKFGAHADLAAYLLGTRDRVLVEASPVDRVWGVGLASDDERIDTPSRWRGLNLLGFALMEARGVLAAGGADRRGDSPPQR
ncbi:NADAR family protein [Nocardioides sp.]|uniref:NADAR family protein n=1 Tax=Nocardioides sp. TaxID=35761 RepID=UPI002726DEC9|nr:NADAR family protein [Nocardioides sp.]MDO9457025.1 NADAR family protein [Nocardioides sp.]